MTEDENPIDRSATNGSEGMTEAEIDNTLMESFPASDPPSWTLGTDHREETLDENSSSADDGEQAE